ncbi:hypothetical protein V6R21_30745 [Limibacter armeniacum]|uniref:hypothetical protein n=1 Tax=Limibacter armeniacum TaxID=466084 RepID=UPI002FE5ECF2
MKEEGLLLFLEYVFGFLVSSNALTFDYINNIHPVENPVSALFRRVGNKVFVMLDPVWKDICQFDTEPFNTLHWLGKGWFILTKPLTY